MSEEEFARLLEWLHRDWERAAQLYLDIHARLTRYFHFQRCNRPEDLADTVFNRIASKNLGYMAEENEKVKLIYGFAFNVLREHRKEEKRRVDLEQIKDRLPAADLQKEATNFDDAQRKCLRCCLQKISIKDSKLLLEYHKFSSGKDKIRKRWKLAGTRRISLDALRQKISRLRSGIRTCVNRCIQA